jgi:tRNA G18 (ribose-2'-O)-methylase SpoU
MSEVSVVGGRRAVVEAIRSGRVLDLMVASNVRETQGMRAVTDEAAAAGITIRETDRHRLDLLAENHQGVVARMRPSDERPPSLANAICRRSLSPTTRWWWCWTASAIHRTWAPPPGRPRWPEPP